MTLLFHISQWFLQISFLIVAVVFLLRPKLIKLFDRYHFLRYIILVIMAAGLWIRPFVSACVGSTGGADAPLHQWLCYVFPTGEVSAIIIAFILLLAEAFYLNLILIRVNVIPKKSLLPAAFYILMMSQSIHGLTLNSVLCGAAFVIPALDLILRTKDQSKLIRNVFISAILFAFSSLFCFEFLFFFPLIFAFLLIYKTPLGMRTALMAIAGFLAVYLLLFLYYFLVGDVAEQMDVYAMRFRHPPMFWKELELAQYILIGWQVYIYYMAISTIIANQDKLNDYTKKLMLFSFSFVLLSLVSILYMMDDLNLALMLTAIPSTIFMGAYISLTTNKKMMGFVEMTLLTSYLVLVFYNLYWAMC